MVGTSEEIHRHFILESVTETEPFLSPQRGGGRPTVPVRSRAEHGAMLRQQVDELRLSAETAVQVQSDAGMEAGLGIQAEFESFPGVELAFESLARERSGIELMNVREVGDSTLATIFIPDGKLSHFENLISDYLAEKQDSIGRPRDNRRLLEAISQIRAASLRALWTDNEEFPSSDDGEFWWEVWISTRQDWHAMVEGFRERAQSQGMQVAQGHVVFPERAVLLAYASVDQMEESLALLNHVAELRRAKETADFFDTMTFEEQREWLDDLLARTNFEPDAPSVPYICLLDTGVNRGHPLLSQALDSDDLHTVDPDWGLDDADGHGTEMAGLALVGNLTDVLDRNDTVDIEHRLESVKLLHKGGATGSDPKHFGYLTQEATARAEITAPYRRRVLGMAITARDNRDEGTPSAWSATLDSIAADVSGQPASPRLIVVSAGNTENIAWANYPHSNDTDGIHDPAQAWNAITVGAYTDLVRITETNADGYQAVAPGGGLSPFSTTSLTWDPNSPLKPDVVLEGGNPAQDSLGPVTIPSLSLLTTYNLPVDRLFTTTSATSAAMALASRMAARIMVEYPELWPETIRALTVHSAEWTDVMRNTYLPPNPTKRDYQDLIRRCGFGVPDISRALWSVANSLTMIVEESLLPFKKELGKPPVSRDMHIHHLPWPQDVLQDLGETQVDMRVTLSYFIEPNPSRRGRSRYRYESHGLRFDVKRPTETIDQFRSRTNAAARDEEIGSQHRGDDPMWLIGKQGRHRGSLHGDIWRGSAAELASRGCIAVYPTMGWWKTRPSLERFDQAARYSLVISIKGPETNVDLYTEVANRVSGTVLVET